MVFQRLLILLINLKIDRNGDLISNIFLVFSLPEIFSDNNTEFRWVRNLGSSAIEKISISIGGNIIDQHYGDWFYIWQELILPYQEEVLTIN